MTVLDASAVLALVHDEPGAEQVAAELPSGTLGTANLAEVIGTLVDVDIHVARVRTLLATAGVTIEPLTGQDATADRRHLLGAHIDGLRGMVCRMKTTLNLDGDLLRQAKQVAASTGTTLTSVVETALREAMRPAPSTGYVFDPPTVHGTRLPQVDVTDREALYEHLDALP